ncbi:DUF2235 domain-containing protein [Halomonas aquamarina]|uniref:DUF2235 domain-containing protein n=1 Tax=Vreelandella aquamarina TaxID=77097 RepID=A0ACC5VUV4_9GAMM|nr:DUF2235 domain-containing protein [Halomonas aquamarina]
MICADGTWNQPEENLDEDYPTNVLKLARAISPFAGKTRQHVSYGWGIGSYRNRISGALTGAGIEKNIIDGYRYIVHNYTPGDDIYLFGFSRGAYNVRALSGLINNCGILKRAEAGRITQAWDIYKDGADKHRPGGEAAKAFRDSYCHPSRRIHFIGVWDTVGALGIPLSLLGGLFNNKNEFYDTKMGSNIATARHALAIDEMRKDFEPTLWESREGVDLKQVWFSGVHSDIGGGKEPDENGNQASDAPLEWMLREANAAGLALEPYLHENLTDASRGELHESRRHLYRLRSKLHRSLVNEAKPTLIHQSVKERYQQNRDYRPPRLEALVKAYGWEGLEKRMEMRGSIQATAEH